MQGRIARIAALSGPLRTVCAEFSGAPDPERLADDGSMLLTKYSIFFSHLKIPEPDAQFLFFSPRPLFISVSAVVNSNFLRTCQIWFEFKIRYF
jgi:hypothetical protein